MRQERNMTADRQDTDGAHGAHELVGARGTDNAAGQALPRVVIVGAGFGGLQAARTLGRAPAHVTVIDRLNHHVFQPLLYHVATADLSPADIAAPIRGVLARQCNTEVLLAEVTGVDLAGRTVQVSEWPIGEECAIPYDYLVLATGARHSYFGHDDWARYAPGLKSLTDATIIRRKILLAFEAAELEPDETARQALLTFFIVGGGPTGVEMAGAIADMAHKALVKEFRHINPATARILLVEAGPRLLPAFPESLAMRAQRALERSGVEVRNGVAVEHVDAEGVLIGSERVAAKTVIWAAGVKASSAGQWLGAGTDRAGRVIVREDLTIPDHPEVFVIGDTANLSEGGQMLPGVAPVAMQEGRYVARVIHARLARKHDPGPFRYFDKGNLAAVGRSFAIADLGKIRLSGFIAWLTWLVVHIAYLIGFRNRILVLVQWAWAYITYQKSAQLITFGPQESPASYPIIQASTDGVASRPAPGAAPRRVARNQ
jgi:NADH dehydrogenase